MGRGVSKNNRLYIGSDTAALDLSCNTLSASTAGVTWDFGDLAAYCWSVKGGMNGQAEIQFGPVNATLYTDTAATASVHDVLGDLSGTKTVVALAMGLTAAPVVGSPCFCAPVTLNSYTGIEGDNLTTMTLEFSGGNDTSFLYDNVWGNVLHELSTETGTNSDTAVGTVVDNGAATAAGGYMLYVVTSLNAGTVGLIVQDSEDGSTYGDIAASAVNVTAPSAGIVQLATNAAVRRYTRFQVGFSGGASTATFFMAFVRG